MGNTQLENALDYYIKYASTDISMPGKEAETLITGFEPFGEKDYNLSQQLIDELSSRGLEGTRVAVLPVDSHKAIDKLNQLLDEIQPSKVIGLGQRSSRFRNRFPFLGNRRNIDIETLARSGGSKLHSSVNFDRLKKKLEEKGVPSQISEDAGGWICEDVYFNMLSSLGADNAIFLHLLDNPRIKDDMLKNVADAIVEYLN